jgi:hypothetical protein
MGEVILPESLLVAHGTHDDVIPIERGREVGDAFRSLSRDFTCREFPIGHGIGDEELSLVAAWLRERLGPGWHDDAIGRALRPTVEGAEPKRRASS